MKASALIAEDEPLLAQALRAELAQVWPELEIAAVVGDVHRPWRRRSPCNRMCCFWTSACPA